MQTILEAYLANCNQITVRISELNQALRETESKVEHDILSCRKRVLQAERLELLEDMQAMRRYIRGSKSCVMM